MLPNFLFIGPDKSGSSWIFRTLGAHPQVFLTPAKDTYYFNRYFHRGDAWYARRFADAGAEQAIIGEICHDYLYSPVAAQRIASTLGPRTNILTCLREPAERAFSDYLNRIRSGTGHAASFSETVRLYPEIVEAGRYAHHLEPYLRLFGSGRVKVMLFDDLKQNPQTFMDELTDWLCIDPIVLTDTQRLPARAAAESRSPRITRLVRSGAQLARELRLESVVGRMKSAHWVETLLYKSVASESKPDHETVVQIRRCLAEDVAKLSDIVGVDMVRAWGYDGS